MRLAFVHLTLHYGYGDVEVSDGRKDGAIFPKDTLDHHFMTLAASEQYAMSVIEATGSVIRLHVHKTVYKL